MSEEQKRQILDGIEYMAQGLDDYMEYVLPDDPEIDEEEQDKIMDDICWAFKWVKQQAEILKNDPMKTI